MPLARLTIQDSVSGLVNMVGAETITGSHGEVASPESLEIAYAGTLSTRGGDTSGTLTLSSGHGVVEGDRIDIYWDGGVAYGATVGEVATNDVPFTGAAGTVLPAQATAITAGVAENVTFSVAVGDIECLAANQENNTRTNYVFVGVDAEDAATATRITVDAGGIYVWKGASADNPFTASGAVTLSSVWISHEDTAAAHTGTFACAVTD